MYCLVKKNTIYFMFIRIVLSLYSHQNMSMLEIWLSLTSLSHVSLQFLRQYDVTQVA